MSDAEANLESINHESRIWLITLAWFRDTTNHKHPKSRMINHSYHWSRVIAHPWWSTVCVRGRTLNGARPNGCLVNWTFGQLEHKICIVNKRVCVRPNDLRCWNKQLLHGVNVWPTETHNVYSKQTLCVRPNDWWCWKKCFFKRAQRLACLKKQCVRGRN